MTVQPPRGEHDLTRILRSLDPVVSGEEYVFLSLPGAAYGDYAELAPIVSVAENEGLTLVVLRSRADAALLPYDGVFARISLGVHSSLESFGLGATLSVALAEKEISLNMVAGTLHDHLFVPVAQAQAAMSVLRQLSS